ncbi:MAG: ferritin-like domain-containing protein [Pyrinomonadaceae bacterium]|nr:ferritin-like domain-containing protein [Pyrinomonadaceae bacterium]
MSNNIKSDEASDLPRGTAQSDGRRTFLKAGGGAAALLTLGAVAATNAPFALAQTTGEVDLGTGDMGIANYTFLLERLEAAFYTQVINTPFAGMTAEERQILTDIRDHEIIHREFIRAALGPRAISGVLNAQFNFSRINFSDRTSVLTTAQIFEDTGVAALNGAGQLIGSTDILVLAGKIASVEGRHAAAIRDLRYPRTNFFAPHAADEALDPPTVLTAVSPFIQTPISGRNLPTITTV